VSLEAPAPPPQRELPAARATPLPATAAITTHTTSPTYIVRTRRKDLAARSKAQKVNNTPAKGKLRHICLFRSVMIFGPRREVYTPRPNYKKVRCVRYTTETNYKIL